MTTASASASPPRPVGRVALSSYLGTTMEFYDFLLYGSAAALVFNKVFFSDLSPALGTIVALATLATGYIARLGGAVLFGHFGDRAGRKKVIITTMAVMGVASGLIGVLPTYHQIGAVAPLLLVLLRVVQGIAVGGEYGGAVLMTTEHADRRRRGLMGSAAAMGAPSGSVLSYGILFFVTFLPEPQLLGWGWRLPFLVSFLLLTLGLYFRSRVPESPAFKHIEGAARRVPFASMWRTHPRAVLKAIFFQAGVYCGQGVFGVFVISYAPHAGYSAGTALLGVTAGQVGAILMTPLYAALSDRIGRKPVVLAGIGATVLITYPCFALIGTGNVALLMVAFVGYFSVINTCVMAVAPVLLTELFPTEIRYTAVSTTYQVAQIFGAGLSPLVAASLFAATGSSSTTLVAAFLVVVTVISGVVGWFLPETRHNDLSPAGEAAPLTSRQGLR